MFKHTINIFNSSSGGLVNHSPGLKYIVTKSRCTIAELHNLFEPTAHFYERFYLGPL